MFTQRSQRLLAISTIWIVISAASHAEADGLMLTAPSGLAPGTTFRFAFLTTDTIAATSTDIATYNTFVNTEAQGATYNGQTISWAAIVSTSGVSAVDNVGEDSSPVYLVNGNQVAMSSDANGLFSTQTELETPIDVTITGFSLTGKHVYTGTNAGGGISSNPLGSTFSTEGRGDSTDPTTWLNDGSTDNSKSVHLNIYAISGDMKVPAVTPEPSTLIMMVSGICGCVAVRLTIRRTDTPGKLNNARQVASTS
jgi:hypothetical protein